MERVTEPSASAPASHTRNTPRKRSIRTRLLILLICAAVVPLFIAFAVGQISTRIVGAKLTAQTQRDLIAMAENRMLRGARAAARLAASEAQQINLVVIVQSRAAAAAIERAHRGEAVLAESGATSIYFSREDFDGAARPVPGLAVDAYGRRQSRDTASIVLAPGVDRDSVRRDIEAMAAAGAFLPSLRRLNETLIESQMIATASGVHVAYPGHGGYPADYDPRQRAWYRDAITVSEIPMDQPREVRPSWGAPAVDATTHRVIIPVSLAVTLEDGSVAGVTAVDIVLRNLVRHFAEEPTWSPNEQLLIVSRTDHGTEPRADLEIYAQLSYDAQGSDWRDPVALEAFAFDDASATRELAGRVREAASGVMRATRDGEDLLCAYAPIVVGGEPTGTSLLFTVPFADLTAIAGEIDDQFWAIIVTQLSSNLAIALAVLGGVVFFAFRFARKVTRPVDALVHAVDRVANGDLDARANVTTGDELELLADDFNSMVPKLSDRMKLRESLDLAMQVQQSLLPKGPPTFPGFDIEGRALYCDETGGDYYDFLMVDRAGDTVLAVAMGDVTGHGIAAALLMTTARALVRSRAGVPGSLAEHITQINALLSQDNEHGRFLTLFFLIMDRSRREIRYVAAGHDPAVIYDPKLDVFRELDGEGGIPLGVEGTWQYQEHAAPQLAPGEVMFLGTDGIWEARDEHGVLFGKERMKEVIRAHAGKAAAEICDAMLDAVRAYRGSVPQLDDITMVAVKAV